MLNCFPIEFVRVALQQKLLEQHIEHSTFFGGDNQVNIMSFYEQLKSQDEVNRFVENYRQLTDQQNRMGLILNGCILSPENPTITNLYSSLIVPMTWTCSLRCVLENRDQAITTISNLIDKLKGKKVDIAQLMTRDEQGRFIYVPFMVGTISQGVNGLELKDGDYIGQVQNISGVSTLISNLQSQGVFLNLRDIYLYVKYGDRIRVVKGTYSNATFTWAFITDQKENPNVIFPPSHLDFEKFKLSLSFDAIRCDEPRNLNENEYCEITFGGSATLVSEGVQLGNDLLKIKIQKYGIIADSDIVFSNQGYYWLEPLEMPSGSNANTQLNQLASKFFLTNTHTDAISLTLQYSFIYDKTNDLLKQLFNYARYGTRGITKNDISPNMLFDVSEVWCSWGDFEINSVRTKIVENIDIENTESDTLTIGLTMQIQGDTQ